MALTSLHGLTESPLVVCLIAPAVTDAEAIQLNVRTALQSCPQQFVTDDGQYCGTSIAKVSWQANPYKQMRETALNLHLI